MKPTLSRPVGRYDSDALTEAPATSTFAPSAPERLRYLRPELPPLSDMARYYALSEETQWYSNRGPCYERLAASLELLYELRVDREALGHLQQLLAEPTQLRRWDGGRSGPRCVHLSHQRSARVGLVGFQTAIEHVKRRTVRTKDLRILSHVEEHVRMVERRPRAHALQFLDADEDLFGADVVGDMRRPVISHGGPRCIETARV